MQLAQRLGLGPSIGLAASVALLLGTAWPGSAVAQVPLPGPGGVPITIRPVAPPLPAPPVLPTPPMPPVAVTVQPPSSGYMTQPMGGVQVQLQSDDLRATLSQLQGGGLVYGLGFRFGAVRRYQTWDPICRMPCGAVVDPNGIFAIRGRGITPSDGFSLPQTGVVALTVRAGHSGVRSGGVIMTTFGTIHTVVGIVFTALGAGLSTDPGKTGSSSAFLITGITNLAVGTALMAGGIAMIVASRTHVTTSDGYTLALGKDKLARPRLALSASGLHF